MAEIVRQEGSSLEFRVVVPQREVKAVYDGVVNSLMQQMKIPGFRPGKAPRSVVMKRAGEEYVKDEVREKLLQSSYPVAVRELNLALLDAEIRPETLSESADFTYTVQAETYPDVTLPNWKELTLEAQSPEITDEVVEKTLSDLLERNASFEVVERPAEAGDQLTLLELDEDEASPYPVYLDSAQDYVREALVGKSAGEEISIVTPEMDHGDHQHESETVRVQVVDIKKKNLPVLDDEFAKTLNFDTVDALRDAVSRELKARAAVEGNTNRRDEFVEKLVEGLQGDLPASLIKRRRDAMFEEIKGDLERQGVPFSEYETFMRDQNKYDDFLADLDKNALQRVKRDLALEKLAEDMKVTLTGKEFDDSLNALARQSGVSVQETRKQLGANGLEGYQASVIRDKALNQAVLSLGFQFAADSSSEETAPVETKEALVEVEPSSEVSEAEVSLEAVESSSEEATEEFAPVETQAAVVEVEPSSEVSEAEASLEAVEPSSEEITEETAPVETQETVLEVEPSSEEAVPVETQEAVVEVEPSSEESKSE